MNEEIGISNHFDEPSVYAADCIICAAGRSRRMGEWKMSLPWPLVTRGHEALHLIHKGKDEGWLIDQAVFAALDAGCRIILVTGFRGDELKARYSKVAQIVVVHNKNWEQGMVSSIKVGITQVCTSWFFVAHGDMPLISADWYTKLLAERPGNVSNQKAIAIRPQYHPVTPSTEGESQIGLHGHPVLFSATTIPFIREAPEGNSLKSVFRACECIPIKTPDQSVISDVDTLEQYITAIAYSSKQNSLHIEPIPHIKREIVPAGSIHLITGPIGAGKTSLLRRTAFQSFINLLRQESFSQFLFFMISQVQTGRGADGKAFGFDIEAFYRTGKGRIDFFNKPLCRTEYAALPEPEPVLVGPYYFYKKNFSALHEWFTPALVEPSDVIYGYIDELGKLELDRYQGLWPLMDYILQTITQAPAKSRNHTLVCTVRQDRVHLLAHYFQYRGFSVKITEL